MHIPLRRMRLSARRAWLRSSLLASALAASTPQPARAAEPAAFVRALQHALAPADVVAGGTIVGAPLSSAGNAAEALLARTPAVMARLRALVSGAQREVLLQTYEWDDEDEAGQVVLAAFVERAHRAIAEGGAVGGGPLRLRIITSANWPSESGLSQKRLRAAIEALAQLPEAAGKVAFEWSTYRGSLMAILHTKTVIVDAAKALVMTGNVYTHGGLATDDVNMGLVLTGPVACGLRADWASARAAATLELASGAMPPVREDCAEAVAAPTLTGTDAAAQSADNLDVTILSRPSNWTYWDRGDVNPQARGILALIDTATETIDIVNPSLSVPSLHRALLRAVVERHVRVRAVVSLPMNRTREHYLFGGDNAEQAHRLYSSVLAAGGPAAADRLHIAWAGIDGEHVGPEHGPANVHAKVASFDGQCLLLGSTNWNWLSFNNGRELSVAAIGTNVALDLFADAFAALWAVAVEVRAFDLPVDRNAADPVAAYLRRLRGA